MTNHTENTESLSGTDGNDTLVPDENARKKKRDQRLTRDEVEIMCSNALRQIERYLHSRGGRPDDFNAKLKMYRILANLARDYCKVIKDREIEEMYEIIKERKKA